MQLHFGPSHDLRLVRIVCLLPPCTSDGRPKQSAAVRSSRQPISCQQRHRSCDARLWGARHQVLVCAGVRPGTSSSIMMVELENRSVTPALSSILRDQAVPCRSS